jgi:molybdopterin-guanine dinucleotide biosynthesis protein A
VSTAGAISAGGRSTRFGSPKALATVRGRRIVDRVATVLSAVVGRDRLLVIANDERVATAIGLPWRRDVLEGIGALAGVHSALLWARERGDSGVLVVGCDMPFIEAGLLRELIARSDMADIVIPGSDGPRGVEPLCAWYRTSCIDAIERAVESGDRRMIGFHDRVRTCRIPPDDVARFGDPARMFLNINTPADVAAAELIAAGLET